MTTLLFVWLAAAATPAVAESIAAEYPAFMRGSGISTRVAVRVKVGAEGRAERVRVEPYSTRHDVLTPWLRASFDSAAVRAVRRWRFHPAEQNGRPVAAWLRLEVPVEEDWTRSEDPHAVMPDSMRSPALWKVLMGEWRRAPSRPTPAGHASSLRFRPGGWYAEVDTTVGVRQGRFEVSSDGSQDDPNASLVLITDSGTRRPWRIRLAGRDTLILCPWKPTGACDTFVTAARRSGS